MHKEVALNTVTVRTGVCPIIGVRHASGPPLNRGWFVFWRFFFREKLPVGRPCIDQDLPMAFPALMRRIPINSFRHLYPESPSDCGYVIIKNFSNLFRTHFHAAEPIPTDGRPQLITQTVRMTSLLTNTNFR